jgi:hypothetical protein
MSCSGSRRYVMSTEFDLNPVRDLSGTKRVFWLKYSRAGYIMKANDKEAFSYDGTDESF